MPFTHGQVHRLFAVPRISQEQFSRQQRIRSAAKIFAEIVYESTDPGPDQDAAVRKIREATLTAVDATGLEDQ